MLLLLDTRHSIIQISYDAVLADGRNINTGFRVDDLHSDYISSPLSENHRLSNLFEQNAMRSKVGHRA